MFYTMKGFKCVFKWPNILDQPLDIKMSSTEWQIWHIWGSF